MSDLVILGAGGFAREVWWLCDEGNQERHRWNLVGFIDEAPGTRGKMLCDLPVLGDFEWFAGRTTGLAVICGVGGNPTRRRFVAKALGLPFVTAVHPTVRCSRFTDLRSVRGRSPRRGLPARAVGLLDHRYDAGRGWEFHRSLA